MNIAQGLKEKNRLAGTIHKLQQQIKEYNRYDSGQEPDLNAVDVMDELSNVWHNLITLKQNIAKANYGVADRLVMLAETKSKLVFWNSMSAYSGKPEEQKIRHSYINNATVEVEYTSFSAISSKDILLVQKQLQNNINTLQDEIDTYNAMTEI